jgi:hypothetical protein
MNGLLTPPSQDMGVEPAAFERFRGMGPGPLTLASLSIFGNDTFYSHGMRAWNDPANANGSEKLSYKEFRDSAPFTRFGYPFGSMYFPSCITTYNEPEKKTQSLTKASCSVWLQEFGDIGVANIALSNAMFIASRAVMTVRQWGPRAYTKGRPIYTGAGFSIKKPKLTVASTVIVTLFLFLQLLGLGILAWLIHQAPAESRSLDVMTFSKIKASMEADSRRTDAQK